MIGRGLLAATVVAVGWAAAAPGAGGVQSRAGYAFRPFATTLSATHVAAPRSEPRRVYVVERAGRVRMVVDGRLRRAPFLDIRRLVTAEGEMGLLSIAFHPAYGSNRRFYVAYSDRSGTTRVVEYRANRARTAAVATSARRLLAIPQREPQHKGGQLAFGPDGLLYFAAGDGACCEDPENRAQDMRLRHGKLMRLDVGRRVPRVEVVGLGLRQPWRFSFDRRTGDLYLGDVGQDFWEEIDYVPRGRLGELANFGWDVYEGLATLESKPRNPAGRLVWPVHVYGHEAGCSVTGGFVYRGRAVSDAVGRYFFGDYCSGAIWSMRVVDGEARDLRRESSTIPGLTSFGEDARGELFAATIEGRVWKLVP